MKLSEEETKQVIEVMEMLGNKLKEHNAPNDRLFNRLNLHLYEDGSGDLRLQSQEQVKHLKKCGVAFFGGLILRNSLVDL